MSENKDVCHEEGFESDCAKCRILQKEIAYLINKYKSRVARMSSDHVDAPTFQEYLEGRDISEKLKTAAIKFWEKD
jgi:hypothetical protein